MQPENKITASSRKKEIVITFIIAPLIAVGAVIVIFKIQDLTGPDIQFHKVSKHDSAQMGLESIEPPPLPPTYEYFDPNQVVSEMPSLTEFNIVPAGTASQKVSDEDLVIGVVINGDARAYPLNMMTGPQREVFNDEVGGVSIAATW